MQSDNTENKKIQSRLDSLAKQGYEVIKFENVNLTYDEYRWIAIYRKKILGRGSYGVVYKAYPINPVNGELILDKKLAVKIYRGSSHQVNPNEAKFFDAYYSGCELISTNEDTYMVMACLPGKNILETQKKNTVLNVEISQFDFTKRVDLIYNIMMAINLMHHNTPNSGNALIHGDINGSNIKVRYDEETGKIDVYIIDFGLSEEIDDDPDAVQSADMNGTPLFMPNELVEHEIHGIKSDIYALTPIFAAILGAKNPFALKTQLSFYNPEYYKKPYDFTGILTDYTMPVFSFDLQEYIIKFLTRMQDNNLDKRPDSDETLRFFTTLNKLCKIASVDNKDENIFACGAKLAIIADGLWKDSEFNKEEEINPSLTRDVPAPEHFDFDDSSQTQTSRRIINAAKQSPLNSPLLKKIMSNEKTSVSKQPSMLFVRQNSDNEVIEIPVKKILS